MGSLGNPKPWVPYLNTKDCSQGFCSIYCPQWCYIIFPPPPPIEFPDDSSGPNFSPLVIAIIGILASAFLLVSYYAIISKYCGNMDRRRRDSQNPDEDLEDSDNPSNHELWHVATAGLDEALIKSITVCKYKRGDGLIQGTDCSVCLGEFLEDESVRLLPKCSHAFHVNCIDTWLRSHSNCPLCRANVVFVNSSPLPLPPPVPEPPLNNEVPPPVEEGVNGGGDAEAEAEEESLQAIPKTPNQLGNSEDVVIEVRDYDDRQMRRSVSMDCFCQSRVSIADVLRLEEDEEGGSGLATAETSKSSRIGHGNGLLHSVDMKRSLSSGRFSLSRHGRERNVLIPL